MWGVGCYFRLWLFLDFSFYLCVYFAHVYFCLLLFPLGVRDWLRLVIMTLPGCSISFLEYPLAKQFLQSASSIHIYSDISNLYSYLTCGFKTKDSFHLKLGITKNTIMTGKFECLEHFPINRSGRWGKNWIMLQKRYASAFALYDIAN